MRLRATLILAMTAVLLVVPPTTAQARYSPKALTGVSSKYADDGFYDIGITGVSDLLVDQTAGEVLVSDGTSLTVTGLTGTVTATKTGLPARLDQMVMSDDGSEVFALEEHTPDIAGGTVSRIDTSTLDVATSTSPVAAAASSIAYSAGLVWVLDVPASTSSDSTLVAVDPTTLTVVGTFDAGAFVDRLVAAPGVAGALYLWSSVSQVFCTLYRVDVTGGASPTATPGASQGFGTGHVYSVDVAADGSEVAAGCGGSVYVLDPGTLTTTNSFYAGPNGGWAYDLKIHSGDDVVGIVNSGATGATPVFHFPSTGDFGKIPMYPSTVSPMTGLAGTLGFGADHLYWIARNDVISTATNSYTYRLGITTPAHTSYVHLSVAKNDGWTFGEPVTVTATLGGLPAADLVGQTLEIYGQTVNGSPVLLGSGPVDSTTGVFAVTFDVQERTSLTAVFPGTDTYAPGFASTWVKCQLGIVAKALKTKRHKGKYALYHYWQTAALMNHIAPNHAGSTYYFVWQYYQNGWQNAHGWQSLVLGSTSKGYYLLKGAKSVVGIKFRVVGLFKGDKRNDRSGADPVYFKFTN